MFFLEHTAALSCVCYCTCTRSTVTRTCPARTSKIESEYESWCHAVDLCYEDTSHLPGVEDTRVHKSIDSEARSSKHGQPRMTLNADILVLVRTERLSRLTLVTVGPLHSVLTWPVNCASMRWRGKKEQTRAISFPSV